MNGFTFFGLLLLVFDGGFVAGAWWATRNRSENA